MTDSSPSEVDLANLLDKVFNIGFDYGFYRTFSINPFHSTFSNLDKIFAKLEGAIVEDDAGNVSAIMSAEIISFNDGVTTVLLKETVTVTCVDDALDFYDKIMDIVDDNS